jgi:integrase
MAFTFRPKRIDKSTGRRVLAKKWYAGFWDATRGKWQHRAGYLDRAATKALADRLEREAAQVAEGIRPPENRHRLTPIAEHIAAYRQYLADQDDTPRHCAEQASRLTRLCDGCGFRIAADLDAGQVSRWLGEQRRARKRFGAVTSNHYLVAVKAFSAWLFREKRAVTDPLESLAALDDRADRRHPRRPLSADEFGRLVDAARKSTAVVHGLAGPARAALYLAAAFTGLRAGELAALTPDWLDLDATTPTVTLRASDDKRRRGAVLPLHPELAAALRAHVAGIPSGGRLWPGAWAEHFDAATMLRADLATAGIPYVDARGRYFDFHGLRHQFITSMARAGVPLTTMQRLARHSSPALTANIYTHLDVEGELAEGINRLPGTSRVHDDAHAKEEQ